MKKTFIEDMNSPLDKVSRGYIRKPATIFLSFFIFLIPIPFGIFEVWKEAWEHFTVKCWNGTE